MKDLMYIYDKKTHKRSELGEIQTDFNISLVIDGTKDTCKIEVFNYVEKEVEPFSILKHEATNNWFVVSHDKVESIVDDSGYIYKHNLELCGAIELLVARDLTDSGFNQNKYTIQRFIERIFNHSNFEFKDNVTINSNNALDLTKVVDYVKTFENYTPLSALREFLDGYNCSVKLRFVESGEYIVGAILDIVSKTGNTNKEAISATLFNNVQEIKTIDKNSFGTTVISNAQNVISTKTKTYPSTGLVKPTGTKFEFNGRDGSMVVRLPSPAYRVNYVDMATTTNFSIIVRNNDGGLRTNYNPFDSVSIQNAFNEIRNRAIQLGIGNAFDQLVTIDMLKNCGYRRFYYEDNYDPNSKTFISSHYIPIRSTPRDPANSWQTVLSNKEMKSNVDNEDNVFYFERGSDIIGGFTFFGSEGIDKDLIQFEAHNERTIEIIKDGQYYYISLGDITVENNGVVRTIKQTYTIPKIGFSINYIPMSDVKIKLDNSGISKDIQLYNQNGKLTDSVALSKSLLSYSKEIESDNVTKYGNYYIGYKNEEGVITRTNNIPLVGDLVSYGNDIYVINNVSMTYYPNDNKDYGTEINYFVECEFTMSKNIATKSLMVNPNTNIRDYGIPQNFNVKRKQLYRDFYELSHTQESSLTTWKLPLNRVLNIGNQYKAIQDHTTIIKLSFDGAYGKDTNGYAKTTWYYQLETTTFVMKKSVYEIVDFKDNNIIGYGSQNVWSGFDISRIIDGGMDMINTPISYVDLYGEVRSFELLFSTNEQLANVYNDYLELEPSAVGKYGPFFSCFIPVEIYAFAIGRGRGIDTDNDKYGFEFKINEPNYFKDATEVPVFEYSCQLDDTDQVLIGNNVFDTYEQDNTYLYSYVFVNKNRYNDNNYSLNNITKPSINQNNIATLENACKLSYENGKMVIRLYASIGYDLNTKEETYLGDPIPFDTTKDIMIIRHRIMDEDLYYPVKGELISTTIYSSLPQSSVTYLNKLAIKNDDKYYICQLPAYDYELLQTTFVNRALVTGNPPELEPEKDKCVVAYEQRNDTLYFNASYTGSPYYRFSYVIGGNDFNTTVYSATIRLRGQTKIAKETTVDGDYYDNHGPSDFKTWNSGFYIPQDRDMTDYDIIMEQIGETESGDICRIYNLGFNPQTNEIFVQYFAYNMGDHNRTVEGRIRIIYRLSADYQGNYFAREYTVQGSVNSGTQYIYLTEYDIYDAYDILSSQIVSQYQYAYNYYLYIGLDYTWDNLGTMSSLDDKILYCPTPEPRNYMWDDANEQLVVQNTYEWVEGGNSHNKFFTYIGDLLKYDANTNELIEITIGEDINRQDLMFIIRDLSNADISSNSISLCINYYRCD